MDSQEARLLVEHILDALTEVYLGNGDVDQLVGDARAKLFCVRDEWMRVVAAEVERLRAEVVRLDAQLVDQRALTIRAEEWERRCGHYRETLRRWYDGGNRGATFEQWIREREPWLFEE